MWLDRFFTRGNPTAEATFLLRRRDGRFGPNLDMTGLRRGKEAKKIFDEVCCRKIRIYLEEFSSPEIPRR